MGCRGWLCVVVTAVLFVGCGDVPSEPELTLQAAPVGASPGGVDDLRVTASTTGTLTVSWTQVSDGTGEPASYRVKYAAPPIDWKTATIGCDRTIRGTGIGLEMSCTIEGLESDSTYDVRLMSFRIVDGVWQDALYSNVATGSTELDGPAPPPTQVTDLAATPATGTAATVSWTEVDDGTGAPAWYRVKYAAPPIVWKSAAIGCDRTIQGSEVGAPISCTIEDLVPGATYDVLLMSYKLVDGVWTNARYSNVATVTMTEDQPLVVSLAERIALLPPSGFTYAHPRDVNNHGQVVGVANAWDPLRTVALVWENGASTELPVPAGEAGLPSSINDVGQILGSIGPEGGGSARVGLWVGGTFTELAAITGDDRFIGYMINNDGSIPGHATTGILWDGAELVPLDSPAGYDIAMARKNNADWILGEAMAFQRSAFVVWSRSGTIAWTEETYPTPFFTGNASWIGITDEGDAYISEKDAGLWRWRDGQLAAWPDPDDPTAARAFDVSPGGLVVGELLKDSEVVRGIWRDDQFYAFDDQSMGCLEISDVYALCSADVPDSPPSQNRFLVRLDFGDDPST